MAIRDRPYGRYNFLVDLGAGGDPGSPDAGFQECSEIESEIEVVEYRNGNELENSPRKLTGLTKTRNVTLRRGIIGSLTLYEWFDQVRRGDPGALRTVEITLQSEDRQTVQRWRLLRAPIIKYSAGPMNARSSDVAIEEMTLAYERLEVE